MVNYSKIINFADYKQYVNKFSISLKISINRCK